MLKKNNTDYRATQEGGFVNQHGDAINDKVFDCRKMASFDHKEGHESMKRTFFWSIEQKPPN